MDLSQLSARFTLRSLGGGASRPCLLLVMPGLEKKRRGGTCLGLVIPYWRGEDWMGRSSLGLVVPLKRREERRELSWPRCPIKEKRGGRRCPYTRMDT